MTRREARADAERFVHAPPRQVSPGGKGGCAGEKLFFSHVHLDGGPAPVRRFLPELIELICNRQIDPGKVFDLELPLDQPAEAYKAKDERRAIKRCSVREPLSQATGGTGTAPPRTTS